jgi:mono/diheme cytochrome c family protein
MTWLAFTALLRSRKTSINFLSPDIHRSLISRMQSKDVNRRVLIGCVFILLAVGVRWGTRAAAPEVIRAPKAAPSADTAIERGRAVYARYGCAMCHGADGKGGFKNPNSETDSKVPAVIFVKEGFTAKEVVKKVLDGQALIGRQGGTGPKPPYRMPGWRDRMSAAEADDLTQFLFSLYPASAAQSWR